MPDEVPTTVAPVQYAIIQTGGTTKHADIVSFLDPEGNRVPAILAIFADEEKALRMRKRMLTRANRMKGFADPKFQVIIPVLGVVQIVMEAKVSRKKKAKEPSTNGTTTTAKPPETKQTDHKRVDQRQPAKA